MNRKQAAALLGISEEADATKANQAFLAKLTELDERIQMAATEALKQKYQGMRGELLAALQVMTTGSPGSTHSGISADEIADLPGAAPVGEVTEVEAMRPPRTAEPTPRRETRPTPAQSRRPLWPLASAGLVVVVLVALSLTGTLRQAWEVLRPKSESERLAEYTQASQLQGEIEQIRKRLEDNRKGLEQQLRDNASEQRSVLSNLRMARSDSDRQELNASLEKLQTREADLNELITQQRELVYDSAEMGRLEGEYKAAERFINSDKDTNAHAVALLIPLKERYGAQLKIHVDIAYRKSLEPEMVSFYSFAIGKYEVTFDEYDRFARETGKSLPKDQGWGRGNRPVINISWDDAITYTKWLSQQTGRRYRLPTEAEWETACGMQADYCGGNDIGAVAWYTGNSGGQTHPVGQKQSNGKGLYDMSGNVAEWTSDCVDHGCSLRVNRGGNWGSNSDSVHATIRIGDTVDNRSYILGFRLAQDL